MKVSEYHPSAGYLIIQHESESDMQQSMLALQTFFAKSAELKRRFICSGFEHNYHPQKSKELFVIRNSAIPASLQPCLSSWKTLHAAAKCSLQFLAEKMGWPDELLFNLIDEPNAASDALSSSVLRAFFYQGGTGEQAGKAAIHHDVGLLTVLPKSSLAALKIYDYDGAGQWVDVEKNLKPGELVVMFAESLSLLSNRKIIPATHRVTKSQAARYSLVYQLRAKPDAKFNSELFSNDIVGKFFEPFDMTAKEFVAKERYLRTSVNKLY